MEKGDRIQIVKGSYPGCSGTIEKATTKTVVVRLDEAIDRGGRIRQVVTVHKTSIVSLIELVENPDTPDPSSATKRTEGSDDELKKENIRLQQVLLEQRNHMEEKLSAAETKLTEQKDQLSETQSKLVRQNNALIKAKKALGKKDEAIAKMRNDAETARKEVRTKQSELEKANKALRERDNTIKNDQKAISELQIKVDEVDRVKQRLAIIDERNAGNEENTTPTAKRKSSDHSTASVSGDGPPSKRQKSSLEKCTNLFKTKMPRDWGSVRSRLEQGGWQQDRASGHIIFSREIVGYQKQKFTMPSTPSSKTRHKRALSTLNALDEDRERLRKEVKARLMAV